MPRVLRAELTKVYVDPLVGPADIRAYIPETHAAPSCERALRGGHRTTVDAIEPVWCDQCTTDDPGCADVRRNPDGSWHEVRV